MQANGNGYREEIGHALETGRWAHAQAALRQLWGRQPSAATAGFVASCRDRMRPHVSLMRCRLFIMRSFTVEPVVPLLRAAAFLAGIDLSVKAGEFNAYAQEILDPAGALHQFTPDAAILAVQTCDVCPALWDGFADLSPAGRRAAASETAARFRHWISAFRERSTASLIVHSLETPGHPNAGVFGCGQDDLIRDINQEIREAAASVPGVYVLDYDGLIARIGRDRWYDEKKWFTVRLPICAGNLPSLAAEWMRFLHPLTGRIAKVMVTDLDNTLWGGVIGEDGISGIRLGAEYPAVAFRNLQRALLDLHRRGILLAIASKNNPEDAMRAIESHPGMLLRPAHFSAMRLNWNDKADSLREIAAELNVGVDSLVFLDDNPAERQRIRVDLPEVTVLELPVEPLGYARAVRECPLFERLSLSAEDGERARYYTEQRARGQLQAASGSLEDFYRSLGQKVEIAPLAPSTLARAAQLTLKTNQFNLTTRRRSEAQLAEFAAAPGCEVWTVRVFDRFGDNGLVGVAMTHRNGGVCEIESLLLSCRVIGRTVETAVLSFLLARARAQGAERLEGWFFPTGKNAPAEPFYRAHGFSRAEERAGASLWVLPAGARIACPPWIELSYPAESVRSEYVHV